MEYKNSIVRKYVFISIVRLAEHFNRICVMIDVGGMNRFRDRYIIRPVYKV